MNAIEIIRKKRNNKTLTNEEILELIGGYTGGMIPDYQFSAFLMATYLQGMNKDETAALTKAMLFSGQVVDLSSLGGAKVDKHSTGGVGDKTSLIIAPIVAAAGIFVPMISGRGLGHTGGTLDKLEAIPGFRTDLNLKEYKAVLKKCGAVLAGQTKEIAPADKLIYALRDVTATVESIPLITSSIMSKKLAEGIDALVLDVKTGSGAFMRETKDAVRLAESLINTAVAFDKKVIAFITDMNQPLGTHIGNWLEIVETVNILKGDVKNDLCELSMVLAGAMIFLGGKAASIEDGEKIAIEQIETGAAFNKFLQIAKAQGGDISYLKNLEKYPQPKFKDVLIINEDGYLSKIDNYEIGMAASMLGAGRMTKEDIIDPKAGIIFTAKLGDKIKDGDVVGEIFSDEKYKLTGAKKRILSALTFNNEKPRKLDLIKRVMVGEK